MAEFSDERSGEYCMCTRDSCSNDCKTYRRFHPEPKTNADKIRAMTDEELAELFWQCCCDCGYEGCFIHDKGVSCLNCCESAFLDWLRQEVKTNS